MTQVSEHENAKPARLLLVKACHLARDNYQIVPPMGLMYLAAVARAGGHEVRILDTRLGKCNEAAVAGELKGFEPDVVGISAISFEAASMKEIARWIKRAVPRTRIVCGGPYPTVQASDCLQEKAVDVAVIGEAEETLPEILDALFGRRPLGSVRGIAFRQDGALVETGRREPPKDLDALPRPAWDLLDFDAYARRSSMSGFRWKRYAPMVTSRGCPYRCGYCHDVHGKKYRARSPENVLAEVRDLVERWGIRYLEFYDDIFNLNRRRTAAILKGIIEANLGINLSFPNGLRADRLDRELVQLLARAGTNNLFLAIEAASPRLQKALGRNLDLDKARQAISWCVEAGIFTGGFFMLGFPGETREEMEATIRFAVQSRLDQALFFRVIPFKGTKVGETLRDQIDFSRHNYFDSSINVSAVSNRELNRLIALAYARFYTPRRLLRLLIRYPERRLLPERGVMLLQRVMKKAWEGTFGPLPR